LGALITFSAFALRIKYVYSVTAMVVSNKEAAHYQIMLFPVGKKITIIKTAFLLWASLCIESHGHAHQTASIAQNVGCC